MTAPEPTWTVEEDYDGDPTLWYGDIAILRQFELESHGLRRSELPIDLLWQVLTRALAPDEATICDIENRANAMDWVTPHEHIEAVLAALAGHVPSNHEAEAAS